MTLEQVIYFESIFDEAKEEYDEWLEKEVYI